MAKNRIWVIEIKVGKNWCPLLDSIYNVRGVHYTRKEARDSKQAMLDARQYKARVQYRVVKYQAVLPKKKQQSHCQGCYAKAYQKFRDDFFFKD